MTGLALAATLAAHALLPQPAQPAPLTELNADLVLTATIHFDSITADRLGAPRVEFAGGLIDRSEWSAERINLPEKLEPGVSYRNAGLRLRILATFKDAEAFLKALEAQARAVSIKDKEE